MSACASAKANAHAPVSNWGGGFICMHCRAEGMCVHVPVMCVHVPVMRPRSAGTNSSHSAADPGREGAPCGPNRSCYGNLVCCDALPYLGGNTSVSVRRLWLLREHTSGATHAMKVTERSALRIHPVNLPHSFLLPLNHLARRRCQLVSGQLPLTQAASRCAARPMQRACRQRHPSRSSPPTLGRCLLSI